MGACIKSPIDVVITDKYPTGVFELCPLMVIGMMQLCLCGILIAI